MSDPWVKDYLRERVIGTLKKYDFAYMKVDYNDTIGIGCDHEDSLGEGLRRNMEETMAFFEEVKREVPGIILENCASGGHRLEPGFLAATAMSSFLRRARVCGDSDHCGKSASGDPSAPEPDMGGHP